VVSDSSSHTSATANSFKGAYKYATQDLQSRTVPPCYNLKQHNKAHTIKYEQCCTVFLFLV